MLAWWEGRLGRSSCATWLLGKLIYDDGIVKVIVHQDIIMLEMGRGGVRSDRLGGIVPGVIGLGELQCIVLELLKGIIIQVVEPIV